MSEKVVLPKFNVPGLRPHWMVMALWGVGGLVVIQAVVFAVIAWRHQGAEAAAAAASAPPAVAAAPAARVPDPVAAPAVAPSAAAIKGAGLPAPGAAVATPPRRAAVARHAGRHAVGSKAKPMARVSTTKRSRPTALRNEELDELLRKFK
jgi:hypothetical protein